MEDNIAIYWWAFNPPTLWHEYVIKEIFKQTKIKKIIITPDWFRLDKSYCIEEKDRINMIEIFVNSLIKEGFLVELEDYFLKNKNNTDTTTMQVDIYFKEKLWINPWHIFGVDISGEIKNWSWNPNKYIEKKLKKIFIPRAKQEFKSEDLENYILINTKKQLDISSTQVRTQVFFNKDISKLVNKEIQEYIIKNNLYKK